MSQRLWRMSQRLWRRSETLEEVEGSGGSKHEVLKTAGGSGGDRKL
jgi:hypothetical protein